MAAGRVTVAGACKSQGQPLRSWPGLRRGGWHGEHPRDPLPWQYWQGGGPGGARGSRCPWERAWSPGHGASRVTGLVSPIQPRSPRTITSSRTPIIQASPFSLLLSSFISQRWQGWKGFWWEMCFELAYFPLRTMEVLSCCILKVQTKAAQAVFSSTVWSFIPPLSPKLQAYLTNFHSFWKEGSETNKIGLVNCTIWYVSDLRRKKKLLFWYGKEQHGVCAVFPPNHRLRVHPPVSLSGCPQHWHGPCHRGFWNSNIFNTNPMWRALYLGHTDENSSFPWETKLLCCKEKQTSLPQLMGSSFGLTWGLWTWELTLRRTIFMKWLQIRKRIAIYQVKEGTGKEMEMTWVQYREETRKKHSRIKTSLDNKR